MHRAFLWFVPGLRKTLLDLGFTIGSRYTRMDVVWGRTPAQHGGKRLLPLPASPHKQVESVEVRIYMMPIAHCLRRSRGSCALLFPLTQHSGMSHPGQTSALKSVPRVL